jgi:ABC-type branched-subunit amino acid transport system ATPase component
VLIVKDIYKSFGGIKALNGVSLEVKEGSVTGLIGPNGSGKTTLFNIISGFYPKDSGKIFFRGERIDNLSSYIIANKGLCRTFQINRAPARMTILENMLLAGNSDREETIFAGLFKRNRILRQQKENFKKMSSLLDLVRLNELANEYTGNTSGGQRKLLSLARILMKNPQLILLDEPTAGVNLTLARNLLEFIKGLQVERRMTFFLIEHNMKIVSQICDIVYVLDAGKIIAQGEPEEIQRDEKVLRAYLGSRRKKFQEEKKED